MSLNKVMLIGHLGQDPSSRSFQNGGKVVNLRVATTEKWKDRNSGERKEKTEWHTVAIFNDALADIAEKYLRKGSKVYIEGQLQTRKWQDQQNNDRYSTEIVLQGFNGALQLLDRRDDDGGRGGQSTGRDQGGWNSGGSYGGGREADLDDDIPF